MAEELCTNPWYLAMVEMIPDLKRSAAKREWAILVPRAASLPLASDGAIARPSEAVALAHVLKPSPFFKGQYVTLSGKTLKLAGRDLVAAAAAASGDAHGWAEARTVRILSEENFYNRDFEPFRVLSIASPITGAVRGGAAAGGVAPPARPTPRASAPRPAPDARALPRGGPRLDPIVRPGSPRRVPTVSPAVGPGRTRRPVARTVCATDDWEARPPSDCVARRAGGRRRGAAPSARLRGPVQAPVRPRRRRRRRRHAVDKIAAAVSAAATSELGGLTAALRAEFGPTHGGPAAGDGFRVDGETLAAQVHRAVETYVMVQLHPRVFGALVDARRGDEAALQRRLARRAKRGASARAGRAAARVEARTSPPPPPSSRRSRTARNSKCAGAGCPLGKVQAIARAGKRITAAVRRLVASRSAAGRRPGRGPARRQPARPRRHRGRRHAASVRPRRRARGAAEPAREPRVRHGVGRAVRVPRQRGVDPRGRSGVLRRQPGGGDVPADGGSRARPSPATSPRRRARGAGPRGEAASRGSGRGRRAVRRGAVRRGAVRRGAVGGARSGGGAGRGP